MWRMRGSALSLALLVLRIGRADHIEIASPFDHLAFHAYFLDGRSYLHKFRIIINVTVNPISSAERYVLW